MLFTVKQSCRFLYEKRFFHYSQCHHSKLVKATATVAKCASSYLVWLDSDTCTALLCTHVQHVLVLFTDTYQDPFLPQRMCLYVYSMYTLSRRVPQPVHAMQFSAATAFSHYASSNWACAGGCLSLGHGMQEDVHDFLRQWLDKAHDLHERLLKAQQPESKVHTDTSCKACSPQADSIIAVALHSINQQLAT